MSRRALASGNSGGRFAVEYGALFGEAPSHISSVTEGQYSPLRGGKDQRELEFKLNHYRSRFSSGVSLALASRIVCIRGFNVSGPPPSSGTTRSFGNHGPVACPVEDRCSSKMVSNYRVSRQSDGIVAD